MLASTYSLNRKDGYVELEAPSVVLLTDLHKLVAQCYVKSFVKSELSTEENSHFPEQTIPECPA